MPNSSLPKEIKIMRKDGTFTVKLHSSFPHERDNQLRKDYHPEESTYLQRNRKAFNDKRAQYGYKNHYGIPYHQRRYNSKSRSSSRKAQRQGSLSKSRSRSRSNHRFNRGRAQSQSKHKTRSRSNSRHETRSKSRSDKLRREERFDKRSYSREYKRRNRSTSRSEPDNRNNTHSQGYMNQAEQKYTRSKPIYPRKDHLTFSHYDQNKDKYISNSKQNECQSTYYHNKDSIQRKPSENYHYYQTDNNDRSQVQTFSNPYNHFNQPSNTPIKAINQTETVHNNPPNPNPYNDQYQLIDHNNQYQSINYPQLCQNQPLMLNLNQPYPFNFQNPQLLPPRLPQATPQVYEKKEKDPSNTLLVADLGPDISKDIIEDIFREKCLELQTSMPEDIHFIEGLHCVYIIFPSIPVCKYVYDALQGYILLNGNSYQMTFTPNMQQPTNKESFTYITHLSDSSSYTTSMETTVHEDWFCEYCDCKNFSRRLQCFRCKKNKTINCRIAPVIKQKTTIMGEGGEIPPSPSLMIRGSILKDSDDAELLEAFSVYGQVKDIRIAKDKLTNQLRDYAFIEFFSLDDATKALEDIKKGPMKLRGCQLFATYSKIKKEDTFPPQQVFSSYAINTTNLTADEKEKLDKINQLQSLCQNSKSNPEEYELVIKKNNNTTVKEKNIRREMTQKQKVENEMKAWAKKAEKKKLSEQPIETKPQEEAISEKKPFVSETIVEESNENVYDTIITFDAMTEEIKKESPPNKGNSNLNEGKSASNDSFLCLICQRKFISLDKLKVHETMSTFHKKNVELQAQNNPIPL